MLDTDAPPGVAGGVAAHEICRYQFLSYFELRLSEPQFSGSVLKDGYSHTVHVQGILKVLLLLAEHQSHLGRNEHTQRRCRDGLPPGVAKGVPAGVVAAEGVGLNSFAFGLNKKDFAFGFSFDVSGFGGTPLPGFELTAPTHPPLMHDHPC
jgi:hypothetical protein